tara:strand:+ start:225 stop:539 length:315 start_codon:yes stop_codon:yes gene_type:complete
MRNISKFFLVLIIFIFLKGCGNSLSELKETMTGQKVTNTDEFLIKKKDPLVLPPEYEKLPLPKTSKQKSNVDTIETVLKSNKTKNSDSKVSTNLENIILEELRK